MINILFGLLFLVIFFPVALLLTRRYQPGERSTLLKILFVGLVMRVGLVFLFSVFMPDPGSLSPDSATYVAAGKMIAQSWKGEGELHQSIKRRIRGQHSGYYYLCASVFYVFGPHVYLPAYLNGFLGIISLLLMINTLARWFAWRVVLRFALFTTFIPSLILWQAFPLKDTVVLFLVTLTFYNYIKYIHEKSFSALGMVVLSLIPIFFFRYYISFVIIGSILISMVLFAGELSLKRILRAVMVSVVIVVGLMTVGVGKDMLNTWNREADVKHLESYRKGLTVDRSAVHADQEYKSSFDIIKYLPSRLTTFLFAPFPWQLANARVVASFIEMPFWWVLFPFVLSGLMFMLRHKNVREFIPLIVYTLMLTLLYAIVQGNLGTAYRMRAQVLPFFLMMASVGVSVRTAKNLKIDPSMILKKEMR